MITFRVPEVLYSCVLPVRYTVPMQSFKDMYLIGDGTGIQTHLLVLYACLNTIMLKAQMKNPVVDQLRGSAALNCLFLQTSL